MGFGNQSRSSRSIASTNSSAKKKAEFELLEQLCKSQAIEICDLQRLLDEAIVQRDIATQQRDEAQARLPSIMTVTSVGCSCKKTLIN